MSRWTTRRLYRNTLVFLASDQTRLQDLDEAVRHHLAWESILAEREVLDLSPHQVRQAERVGSVNVDPSRLGPAGQTPPAPATW